MAAFSYQHHPFLLDPDFLPNTPINVSGFSEEPNNPTSCFSHFYPPESLQQISFDVSIHESSSLENGTLTNKQSTDSSSVVDKPEESSEQVSPKVTAAMEKKRKNRVGSSISSAQSKDAKEVKGKKQKKCKSVKKDDDEEKKLKADKKDQKKVLAEAPQGYIHVRARRGQATDNHSLAERMRREKISERMKLLRSLVPGCDKVTGKALVLDEIIYYVQSLQNQVEFLSMKLATVNPMFYDFGMDLDEFMVTPESLNSMASPLLNVQEFNPAQATEFSDTISNYPLLDSSSSLLFDQQVQRPNILPQDNGQLLWDVDDQRQKLINQSAFVSNNLCSFH